MSTYSLIRRQTYYILCRETDGKIHFLRGKLMGMAEKMPLAELFDRLESAQQ